MQVTEHRSEFWPTPTAHRAYWERHNCSLVYEYDPTDDGPECETIKAILATHTYEELNIEFVVRFFNYIEEL